jgi:hypothetical protein
MKKQALGMAIILLAATGLGCGKSSTKASHKKKAASGDVWTGMDGEVTSKLVTKKLDASGLKGLTLKVPENAKVTAAMKISKNDPNVAQISNDMGFSLWLHEDDKGLAGAPERIEKSSFKKFVSWVSKQPDALIFKAKGLTGEPEYHFQVALKVGGKGYLCRNLTSVSFRKLKDVTQMVAACRTLKKQ